MMLSSFLTRLKRWPRRLRTHASSGTEYAVLIAFVGAIIVAAALGVGFSTSNVFTTVENDLANALETAENQTGGTANGGGQGNGGGEPVYDGFRAFSSTADDKRVCVHGLMGPDSATYCWGVGWEGALGHGSIDSSLVPVQSLISGALSRIDTSANLTCGIQSNTLWCWGENVLTPTAVTGLPAGVRTFTNGTQTCSALENGSVWCRDWIGDWSMLYPFNTVDVAAPFVGAVCLLMTDRSVQCGGDSDFALEWANFNPVAGVTDVDSMVATRNTLCTLTGTTVSCFGKADNGLLGTGETSSRRAPAVVPGASGATALVAHPKNRAICAVMPGGDAKCWGMLPYGPGGTTIQVDTPTTPPNWPGGYPIVGDGFLCAILGEGGVSCMGNGSQGQLGDGNTDATDQWRAVAFPNPV